LKVFVFYGLIETHEISVPEKSREFFPVIGFRVFACNFKNHALISRRYRSPKECAIFCVRVVKVRINIPQQQ